MARRPAPKRYAKALAQDITYRPEHDELFDLAGADWARPQQLRTRTTKTGWSFEARFTMPSGQVVALRARARKYADGKVFITDRTMAFRFLAQGPVAIK
ncbi:hypothetical protein BH10PSE5_BH10PSE5_01460 [soil metagenome]